MPLGRKTFYVFSGVLVACCTVLAAWGAVDRILTTSPESPYHDEWSFFTAVLIIMIMTGYTLLRPGRQRVRVTMGLVGSLVAMILFLAMAAAVSGVSEGLSYAVMASALLAVCTVLLAALKMRSSELLDGHRPQAGH